MTSDASFNIDYREPTNVKELEGFLGLDAPLLERLISPNKWQTDFIMHRIPKRGACRLGEYRIVWEAASFVVADVYKRFSRTFDLFAQNVEKKYPHPSAYGYVRHRNTKDNAEKHCGASRILHADITNYFPSISILRIKDVFIRFGLQVEVAEILAEFVTLQDKLPLGLHPSPMLANLVCLDLDDKIRKLASKYQCEYTRYADDISISGDLVPSRDEIASLLETEGFVMSKRKFRITKPGQAHYVTGLSVTDQKPRIPRKMKKQLRQELYYCRRFGIREHLGRISGYSDDIDYAGVCRIDGTVRYVSYIEKDAWPDLRSEWMELLLEDDLVPVYSSCDSVVPRKVKIYVDETSIKHNGADYLAMSFVQTLKADQINETTRVTLRKYIVDPFTSGHKKRLETKKLHYTDAHEDLRFDYIKELAIMPFRGYLVYGKMTPSDSYEKKYLSFATKILSDRFRAFDQACMEVVFEENTSINKKNINAVVNELYHSLERRGDRRPLKLDITVGKKKDHPCFSVPDFMLGVFAKYAKLGSVSHSQRDALLFERLRDRYRKIVDADSNMVFSRKRPFYPWNTML